MGNRAVLVVRGEAPSLVGIYLHWNGGPESVLAFLEAAKRLGVRSPANDPAYCRSRLVQIIGNFMGGTLSVGVDELNFLDTESDNGIYYVGGDFEIRERSTDGPRTVAELDADCRKRYEEIVEDCVAQNTKLFAQE